MNEVYEFLKTAGTYYLATVEGDQPRVRPFGTVDVFEGRLYIQTGKSECFFGYTPEENAFRKLNAQGDPCPGKQSGISGKSETGSRQTAGDEAVCRG